jgi:dsDNA-specific endonuclease/ATPase MutS2
MRFKIGDRVRFLNEKGEGTVTKIINKTTVGVTIEDGFELPFIESELVTVFDESKVSVLPTTQIVEEPEITYTSKISNRKETPKGIYLAVSPEHPSNIANSDFNIWLINHTDSDIMFCISSLKGKGYEVLEKGNSKAYEAKLIDTVSKKNLDMYGTLKADIIFYSTKPFEHQQPVSEIVKVKLFKLYKENAFSENDLIPEKAMIINVSDQEKDLYFDRPEAAHTDLSKLLFQKKANVEPEKRSKPHKINNNAYEMEIDLHIEELIDNYKGMSNAEIVIVQLRHFQKALDTAITHHYRSLTVIHGVGNGRLKQEVHAILKSMKLRFHDASYSKYGFGATEIVF